jgi:hypothetical protein
VCRFNFRFSFSILHTTVEALPCLILCPVPIPPCPISLLHLSNGAIMVVLVVDPLPREKREDGGGARRRRTHEPFWCLSEQKRYEDTLGAGCQRRVCTRFCSVLATSFSLRGDYCTERWEGKDDERARGRLCAVLLLDVLTWPFRVWRRALALRVSMSSCSYSHFSS